MSKDYSLTTFSSKGTLKQLENALQAVNNGQTAIGIRYKTGVVLITEKNLKSLLVDSDSIQKIQSITGHVGSTFAGLFGDYRVLLQYARRKNAEFKLSYEEPIPLGNITRKVAEVFQELT